MMNPVLRFAAVLAGAAALSAALPLGAASALPSVERSVSVPVGAGDGIRLCDGSNCQSIGGEIDRAVLIVKAYPTAPGTALPTLTPADNCGSDPGAGFKVSVAGSSKAKVRGVLIVTKTDGDVVNKDTGMIEVGGTGPASRTVYACTSDS